MLEVRISNLQIPLTTQYLSHMELTDFYGSSPACIALSSDVEINIPLLIIGNFIDLLTFLRGVLSHIVFTGRPQLRISFIGDKPMCPPILKCALVVMVIVNYRISNLEH